jgi:uncharacterized protein involved in oxidation of intracellular sulfur
MPEAEKIVYILTHAGDDPERATFPFTLATAGQSMDIDAVIALQGTAVFLAKQGYTKHVAACGLKPLNELMDTFLELGGRILVCQPCIKERNIQEQDLVSGASITAAAQLNEEILSAQATLVY